MCASPTVVSHLPTHPPRWETGTTLLLPSLLGCCREPGDALCLQSPAAAPTPGPPPRVAMPPPAGFLPLGSSEGFTSLHVRLQWSFALLLRKHSFLECMGK